MKKEIILKIQGEAKLRLEYLHETLEENKKAPTNLEAALHSQGSQSLKINCLAQICIWFVYFRFEAYKKYCVYGFSLVIIKTRLLTLSTIEKLCKLLIRYLSEVKQNSDGRNCVLNWQQEKSAIFTIIILNT